MPAFRVVLFRLLVGMIVMGWPSECVMADTIVLDNGDRLTGEIQKLAERKLSLKTSYAGTVEIDWDIVSLLTTDSEFEVEVETGQRYTGKLSRSAKELEVKGHDSTITLEIPVVVGLTQVEEAREPSFWQHLEGAVDFGLTLMRGSSFLNQSSFAATSTYLKEGYRLQAGLTSLTSQQDDSDQESRQTARLRFDRFVSPKLFQFLITSFEHNDRQRLNFRTTLGGGLGKTLVKTKKTELSLLGGVVFTTERFRADEATGDPAELIRSGEGLAGIEWETRLIDRVRLTSKFAVLPGLSQEGRYRLEYDATLRIPLVRNLTWNVTVFDRFDSKPPTEVPRNDFGMVSGLGIVF